MAQQVNLDREFVRWFFEDAYPEVGKNRATFMQITNKNERDYWMRQAYMAGCRQMAQDLLDTLADYATACEGLEPEMMTPSEVFDRARENLFVYATSVLDKAKA